MILVQISQAYKLCWNNRSSCSRAAQHALGSNLFAHALPELVCRVDWKVLAEVNSGVRKDAGLTEVRRRGSAAIGDSTPILSLECSGCVHNGSLLINSSLPACLRPDCYQCAFCRFSFWCQSFWCAQRGDRWHATRASAPCELALCSSRVVRHKLVVLDSCHENRAFVAEPECLLFRCAARHAQQHQLEISNLKFES